MVDHVIRDPVAVLQSADRFWVLVAAARFLRINGRYMADIFERQNVSNLLARTEEAITVFTESANGTAEGCAESHGQGKDQRLLRGTRSRWHLRPGDDACVSDRERLLLCCFLEAGEEGLVKVAIGICRAFEFAQLHLCLAGGGRHAACLRDTVLKGLSSRLRDLKLALIAFGDLGSILRTSAADIRPSRCEGERPGRDPARDGQIFQLQALKLPDISCADR